MGGCEKEGAGGGGEDGRRGVKKSESRSATLGKAERKGESRNKGFRMGGCSGRVHGEIYGENKGGNMEVTIGGRTPGEEEHAWRDQTQGQDFRKKTFFSSHLLHHFIPFRVTGRGHIRAKAGPTPG